MPDLTEAYVNLGIALYQQKETEQALKEFEAALRLNPTNALALKYVQALHSRASRR